MRRDPRILRSADPDNPVYYHPKTWMYCALLALIMICVGGSFVAVAFHQSSLFSGAIGLLMLYGAWHFTVQAVLWYRDRHLVAKVHEFALERRKKKWATSPTARPKIYIVTGVSGSGKTTIARALNKRGEVAFDSKVMPGIYHFADKEGVVSAIPDWNNEIWQQTYTWKLNRPMLGSLLEIHKDSSRVFLCGRANLYQYMDIAERTFLLRVTPQTLKRRLNDKTRDNLFAKDAPTQQMLVDELEATQSKIMGKGAVVVDAEQSVNHIVDAILAKV